MEANAILGAVLGAIVGAIAWAGIAAVTGYEIGWIAWGVGGLVGLGAFLMEGRGAASGIMCAVLAVLAILAGKFMALHAVAGQEMEIFSELGIAQEIHAELSSSATAFASVTSEEGYPAFMVANGYTEAETADDVFPSEIEYFKTDVVPELQAWNASPPSFEEWNDENFGTVDLPMGQLFVESLGPIDVLFFALGIGTAFRVGSGGEYE